MCPNMNRIQVQSNYGTLLAYDAQPQSDEESTEPVLSRKPILETKFSSMCVEEEVYGGYDFWGECGGFSNPVFKVVTPEPSLAEDEWMELNQDFARDNSHQMEEVKPVVKTQTHVEETYADYDMWGESDAETEVAEERKPIQETPSLEDDVWWQMNQDFARDANEGGLYTPRKKAVVKRGAKKVCSSAPPIGNTDWMEINHDFARDNCRMEIMEEMKPASETPCGDYYEWGESE